MNARTKEAILYHCQREGLPPQLVIELLEVWKDFHRAVDMPVANEAEREQTQEVAFVPLFSDDPAARVEQQAIQRLVERVADLFDRRDWHTLQERLAEAVDQYEAEQEKRRSDSHLMPWRGSHSISLLLKDPVSHNFRQRFPNTPGAEIVSFSRR